MHTHKQQTSHKSLSITAAVQNRPLILKLCGCGLDTVPSVVLKLYDCGLDKVPCATGPGSGSGSENNDRFAKDIGPPGNDSGSGSLINDCFSKENGPLSNTPSSASYSMAIHSYIHMGEER